MPVGDTPHQGAQTAPGQGAQGSQPSPPAPSPGSPFGRFATNPILAVALIALVVCVPVAIGTLSSGDSGSDSPAAAPTAGPGPPPGGEPRRLAGVWTGTGTSTNGAAVAIELRIARAGEGTLRQVMGRRAVCTSLLTLRDDDGRTRTFDASGTDPPPCVAEGVVTVTARGRRRLDFEQQGITGDGIPVTVVGVLRRG